MIISIQGPTAVGKTTAIAKLIERNTHWIPFYENMDRIRTKLCALGPDDGTVEWFIQNQEIFLDDDIEGFASVSPNNINLWDNGLEEVAFYCLNDPRHRGKTDIVQERLSVKINAVMSASDRIIYLDDNVSRIKLKKDADHSRSRKGFQRFMTLLRPLHRQWFQTIGAQVINVTNMNPEGVASKIEEVINAEQPHASDVDKPRR